MHSIVLRLTSLLAVAFSALVAENVTVAIDPGHTKERFGATSAAGLSEYGYNIVMSKVLLRTLNQAEGVDAFIINPHGVPIKLRKRTAIAIQKGADIFISIHHDSVQPRYLQYHTVRGKKLRYTTKFKGYSLFVSQKNRQYPQSLQLAKEIGTALQTRNFAPTLHHAEKIKGENRPLLSRALGVYRFDNLVVLKSANLPSVLLECGIIINPEEERRIQGGRYHQRMAEAVRDAVVKFIDSLN